MKRPDRSADPYRPSSGRQRLVILAVAIAMAVLVMVAMLSTHVRFLRADKARQAADAAASTPADTPACTGARTQGCVGGTMGVIAAPPAASAAGVR
jgi:hypothetical protein